MLFSVGDIRARVSQYYIKEKKINELFLPFLFLSFHLLLFFYTYTYTPYSFTHSTYPHSAITPMLSLSSLSSFYPNSLAVGAALKQVSLHTPN